MIKEFHGKKYYMELETYQLVIEAIYAHNCGMFPALENELFVVKKLENGNWVFYSEAPVESFRGQKYREWERFKRYIYKLKA